MMKTPTERDLRLTALHCAIPVFILLLVTGFGDALEFLICTPPLLSSITTSAVYVNKPQKQAIELPTSEEENGEKRPSSVWPFLDGLIGIAYLTILIAFWLTLVNVYRRPSQVVILYMTVSMSLNG